VVYGSTPLYSAHDDDDTLSVVWSEADATPTQKADPTAAFVAHGAVRALSFLFLYPGGAVASVLREHMEPGRWYHLHRYVQILATLVTIAALIVAFVLGESETLASTHAKLGLAVFFAAISGMTLISFNSSKSGESTKCAPRASASRPSTRPRRIARQTRSPGRENTVRAGKTQGETKPVLMVAV
jgi:hypothetical protein